MNVFLFSASVFLSSVGVSTDAYTSSIFIKDLGIEYEGNILARYFVNRWGYRRGYRYWLLLETFVIMVFGIIDSMGFLFPYAFLGLVWLVARGLMGARNLQHITEYRIIGIDSVKEKDKSRRQAFQNVSFSNKLKLDLPYFIEILACWIVLILLAISGSPLRFIISSLIWGLYAFFARVIQLESWFVSILASLPLTVIVIFLVHI